MQPQVGTLVLNSKPDDPTHLRPLGTALTINPPIHPDRTQVQPFSSIFISSAIFHFRFV